MLIYGNFGHAWLLLASFVVCFKYTQAEQILAIFSYGWASPYLLVEPFINKLVERGHQVTVISAVNHFSTIQKAHHIRVAMLDQLMQDLKDWDFGLETTPSKWQEAIWVSYFYDASSRYILADPTVQQLLHNSSVHFDMVILDTPHSDALCGFAKHFNAPMVGISAYGSTWIVDYLAGNSAPSVFDPMSPVGYTYNSPFLMDKWRNWIYMTEEWLLKRLVFLPPQIKLYRKYFDDSDSNFDAIRRNFSLILVNQHFSLGRVRSNVPNLIEVAGMHLCFEKDCKLDPMPDDLQSFMDEAEHGVIYFSMGLEIFMKWLPTNIRKTLLETFSNLKQRVIWKYEEWDLLKNISDNIFVRSFLPQQQILNHPNVKLFITHGGLLSLTETIYYGVPVLTLPLYYDQFANAQRMRVAGVGQTLDLNSINVEMLNQSIHEIVENPLYARNAQKMSSRFRDHPMNPLDTAVWWTEYTLRHKDVSHMRIAEHDISFLQYYSIDLVSILFGRIGLSAFVVILIGYKLTNYVRFRSQISRRIHLIR